MCGIGGAYSRQAEVERAACERMLSALRHRGPDGEGIWLSEHRRVALVHTRLAILDLSAAGAQPMHSRDGRFHLSYNGEIYNYKELREELLQTGAEFRGESDTEVLLHLLAKDGVRALNRLDGMFAFALYDAQENTLLLARDPLGEKPLYYADSSRLFCFASEANALTQTGWVGTDPSIVGIAHLLRQGSIPPPHTHLRDVKTLPPGHVLQVSAQGVKLERYYDVAFSPDADTLTDPGAAREELKRALRLSVAQRLRADVPVGAFLSGGVDSAAVCALAAEHAPELHTFTVTMPGQPGDEARAARDVARHLDLAHQEIPLDLNPGARWLERALSAMDVPSVDGVNTWLVSGAVRGAGMKVACSGLGGDELFWGYPSFRTVPRARRFTRFLGALAHSTSPSRRHAARTLARSVPVPAPYGKAVDALLAGGGVAALWFAQRGLFSERETAELMAEAAWGAGRQVDPMSRLKQLLPSAVKDVRRQVSLLELQVYLQDQLLRDTDCMSMAHGLEVRVPLIGLPVVNVVRRLSASVLEGTRAKSLLVDAVQGLLPPEVFQRRKQGFTLPWSPVLAERRAKPAFLAGLLRPDATARVYEQYRQTRRGASRVLALEALYSAAERNQWAG